MVQLVPAGNNKNKNKNESTGYNLCARTWAKMVDRRWSVTVKVGDLATKISLISLFVLQPEPLSATCGAAGLVGGVHPPPTRAPVLECTSKPQRPGICHAQ